MLFEELSIIATVPTPVPEPAVGAPDSAYFPVSMDVSIMSLESQDFAYTVEESGDVTIHTMTLSKKDKEIYSFAVWGRLFERDGFDATPPVTDASTAIVLSKFLLLVSVLFFKF